MTSSSETMNKGSVKDDVAINEVIETFLAGWNEHDAQKFAAVFEDDADHTNVLGMHKKGREEIEASHKPLFETIWSASTLSNLETCIRYIAENIASVDLRWELINILYPNKSEPASRLGLIHFVMRKGNQGWKVAVMHNMDVPGKK